MKWFISQNKVNFKALGTVCVWLVEKEFDEFKLSTRDGEKQWKALKKYPTAEEARRSAEVMEREYNLSHPEARPPDDMTPDND